MQKQKEFDVKEFDVEESKSEVKNKVLILKLSANSEFESRVEKVKKELENKDEEEINDFVTEQFNTLNEEFLKSSHEIEEYVKSVAPKKPKKENFDNEDLYKKALEDYETHLSNYKSFISWTTKIILKITEWLKDFFSEIKKFFHNLWNWIKNAFKDIYEKVKKFLEFKKFFYFFWAYQNI